MVAINWLAERRRIESSHYYKFTIKGRLRWWIYLSSDQVTEMVQRLLFALCVWSWHCSYNIVVPIRYGNILWHCWENPNSTQHKKFLDLENSFFCITMWFSFGCSEHSGVNSDLPLPHHMHAICHFLWVAPILLVLHQTWLLQIAASCLATLPSVHLTSP